MHMAKSSSARIPRPRPPAFHATLADGNSQAQTTDQRLQRLERLIEQLQQSIDVSINITVSRMAAIQAELDTLRAKQQASR